MARDIDDTTMEDRENIRRNCRQFREEVSMTQEELANAAGLATASVARYEAGRSMPDRDALRKLANFYGRPVEHFFLANPPPADPAKKRVSENIQATGVAAEKFGLKITGASPETMRALDEFLKTLPERSRNEGDLDPAAAAKRSAAAKERRNGKKT